MRSLLFLIFSSLFLFSYSSYGQQSGKKAKWTTYKELKGVNISYKYIECAPGPEANQQMVILKFENNNAKTVNLNWNIELWYNGECRTCLDANSTNSYEYAYSLELAPNETKVGKCEDKLDNRLVLFSKFLEKVPGNNTQVALTKFNLGNLTIN